MAAHECRTSAEVHADEIAGPVRERRLYWRRRARGAAHATPEAGLDYPLPDATDLVGLSLSGGGIRSAMFNLGFLQALEAAGLMKHVDFLSSVSGGGYTNGYYSTLGHFAPPDARQDPPPHPNAEATSVPLAGLSARDTQFLLDGQYLNRPVEFLTAYALSTFLLAGTLIAWLVALAAVIALYFRAFDAPATRRWLALFDVRTDLGAGVFASLLLGVLAIVAAVVVRRVQTVCGFRVHRSPGRWAVLLGGALLLGMAVMIGNGDFFISEGHGWLPRKLDLRSLQTPIMIAIALLFSPLLRVGTLLQSERVNASPWQRVALRIVLLGTTWGALFALVGWIGRENVSGYVTDRPPTLVPYDVWDYADLARLLETNDIPGAAGGPISLRHLVDDHPMPAVGDGATAAAGPEVDAAIGAVLERDARRARARLDLWPSRRQWTGWRVFGGATLSRWLAAVGALVRRAGGMDAATLAGSADRVLDLVESERGIIDAGRPLIAALNGALGLSLAAADDGRPAAGAAGTVTGELCRLAAARVKDGIGDAADLVPTAADGAARDERRADGIPPALAAGADDGVAAALRTLDAWDGTGLTAGADGHVYRQLGTFRRLLERVMLTPVRYRFDVLSAADLALFNRMLLEIAYPEIVKERTMVSTSVVVAEDQRARRVILFWAALLGAVGLLVLDLNRVCAWFHFYRQRVADTFLRKANVDGAMPLRLLQPTRHGHPYPLFVAGMFLPQAPVYGGAAGSVGADPHCNNPTKLDHSVASNWYSFLFSPAFVGWLPTGPAPRVRQLATYRPTAAYLRGGLGVDEAIVLSGAAVTPYMAENRSLRMLMHMFNARLEQWLPNPRLADQPQDRRFTMIDLGREVFSQEPWGEDSWRYGVVADGGFREFLGVEELVARRCRIVIVSDAGCNNGLYEFGVLADLIRKLRLDHGVEVLDLDHDRPLDTRRLKRLDELGGRSPQHSILGRIRYPETAAAGTSSLGDGPPPREALLVYVQMSLTGDEDIDIEQFRRTNPRFPDEPISNQFYTRDQVESFRQLGQHVGQLLCRGIEPFDCRHGAAGAGGGSAVEHPGPGEDTLRAQRINRLVATFVANYRAECRQENVVAGDDARMGWTFRHDDIGGDTLARIHRYESSVEHQLLIRDFVWMVLDGTGSDRLLALDQSPGDSDRRLMRITPMDLYGIAIECNRRHAGFRREWPTAFFQVGGRELLVKAAHAAHQMVPALDDAAAAPIGRGVLDEFAAWTREPTGPTPRLVRLLARLAVMIPRGVFRQRGDATASDALVCLVVYLIRYRLGRVEVTSFDWIQAERPQLLLRRAIATGKPGEVERALVALFVQSAGEDG